MSGVGCVFMSPLHLKLSGPGSALAPSVGCMLQLSFGKLKCILELCEIYRHGSQIRTAKDTAVDVSRENPVFSLFPVARCNADALVHWRQQ